MKRWQKLLIISSGVFGGLLTAGPTRPAAAAAGTTTAEFTVLASPHHIQPAAPDQPLPTHQPIDPLPGTQRNHTVRYRLPDTDGDQGRRRLPETGEAKPWSLTLIGMIMLLGVARTTRPKKEVGIDAPDIL